MTWPQEERLSVLKEQTCSCSTWQVTGIEPFAFGSQLDLPNLIAMAAYSFQKENLVATLIEHNFREPKLKIFVFAEFRTIRFVQFARSSRPSCTEDLYLGATQN